MSRNVLGTLCVLAAVVMLNSSVRSGRDDQPTYVRNLVIDGYPPMARLARAQGDVSATLHLDAQGNVVELSDVKGPRFLLGAESSLKKWKFAPLHAEGATVKVTLRFSLAGPERADGVTRISAALPHLVEIVTNPAEKAGPDVVLTPIPDE